MSQRRIYIAWNGATAALTAGLAGVTTGTAVKTMMQIKPTTNIEVIEWGYSFDVAPTAVVKVELITTGAIAATVTAYNAGDVRSYDDASNAATAITLGTTASGFTCPTTEGTITSTRLLDGGFSWAQQYSKQFPLDREPGVVSTDYLRVRVTTATAINMLCYVVWSE